MRKKNKNKNIILVDLKARGNIKIICSAKKEVSSKQMQEFENRSMKRYNNYSEFTDLCIKMNMEKNKNQFSKQKFVDAMRSMLEQNELLEDMINIKEREN